MTYEELLEKLNPELEEAANIIKQAVDDRRLVILRHHADCDGYCGALAIEKVILPIIQNQNMKAWQKYKRLPMKTPFYHYMDALKDINTCKISIESNKRPLIVMIDNGSGKEDLLPIRRLRQYPIDLLIIDHHLFSEEISKHSTMMINSRRVLNTGEITAGILGFEIANKIGKADPFFAALSAVSDKSSDEIKQFYGKIAGKNEEFLQNLASCIDFEAHNLGFSDSDTILDFFNDKQEEAMNILLPYINDRIEKYKDITKKYLKKDGDIYSLDLEKVTLRNEFPMAGRVTGIAHRVNSEPRITIGFTDHFLSYRAEGKQISIADIISTLKEKLPFAMIDGGGHDRAGSIKFIPAAKEEVLKTMTNYLKNCKNE